MSKLTKRLEQVLAIYNASLFARHGQATAWISYSIHHPHALGHQLRRATLHFTKDGKEFTRDFREHEFGEGAATPAERRAACVRAATEHASERFGISEWVAGPFRDSWMPRAVRERVLADLKAAEGAK